MLNVRTPLLVVVSVVALLLGGCVETVKSTPHPALWERREPITHIAVAPFAVSEGLTGMKSGELQATLAAELLGTRFAEALTARGIQVVPPSDVALALEAAGVTGRRLLPREVASVSATKFGADAVVVGRLTRVVAREGNAAGASRPASVGFVVNLHGAPGAARLWTGNFDETQRPLSENVLDASRLPGGGSRWLTVEELLSWGAREVATAMPLGPS